MNKYLLSTVLVLLATIFLVTAEQLDSDDKASTIHVDITNPLVLGLVITACIVIILSNPGIIITLILLAAIITIIVTIIIIMSLLIGTISGVMSECFSA